MPASPRQRGFEAVHGSANQDRSPNSSIQFGESTQRMQEEKCRIQEFLQKCLSRRVLQDPHGSLAVVVPGCRRTNAGVGGGQQAEVRSRWPLRKCGNLKELRDPCRGQNNLSSPFWAPWLRRGRGKATRAGASRREPAALLTRIVANLCLDPVHRPAAQEVHLAGTATRRGDGAAGTDRMRPRPRGASMVG